SGDPYTGDQYFRITNNSDEVLYADGLFIAESAFQQMIHQDYNQTIRRFPNVLVARMFGFDKMAKFEAASGADKAPDLNVDFNL
ncbi:MAG: LemA family protein, partial [Prevotella sp.]